MTGARDGDVAKAGVEQVWVDARVGVYQDPFGGKSLGAMAGNGVAEIEMAIFNGIEFNAAVDIEMG